MVANTRASSLLLGSMPLLVLVAEVSASLPYNPYYIFSTSVHNYQNDGADGNDAEPNEYYILEPPTTSSPSGRLLRFDLSSSLTSSSIPTNVTITSTLPFLDTNVSSAYVPALRSDGSITVYAGRCDVDSSGSSLWTFNVTAETDGDLQWTQEVFKIGGIVDGADNASSGASTTLPAARYLSSAFSFQSESNGPDDVYVFGGMCPDANSTADSWTSDATYNNILSMFRPNSSSLDNVGYSTAATVGQPTAEAGFTITPLLPTYSNQSDGTQSRQTNFVLIGGHTQTAFIDMNIVGLFSLPQATWTFPTISVNFNSQQGPDLARSADTRPVEPRSGHTAVLTNDGSRMVIFGGWVGDIKTAAQPQLAILEIGSGYGGSSDWAWTLPDANPFAGNDTSSQESSQGIYGHGAAMLPGDIMVVYGGYTISESANSGNQKKKRAVPSDQNLSNRNYFFNTTSASWIDSYDPSSIPQAGGGGRSSEDGASGGLLRTSEQKAGLGAGLAVALLVLIGVGMFSFFYYRRLRRERKRRAEELWADREKEVDDLGGSNKNNNSYSQRGPGSGARTFSGGGGADDTGNQWPNTSAHSAKSSAYPWTTTGDNDNGIGGSNVRDAERSGLYVEIPSPKRGLRRSMYGRVGLQSSMAPRQHDDGTMTYGAFSDMQAIQERDEENSSASSSRQASGTYNKAPSRLALDTTSAAAVAAAAAATANNTAKAADLNPFLDPVSPIDETDTDVLAAVSTIPKRKPVGRILPFDTTANTTNTMDTSSAVSATYRGSGKENISSKVLERAAAIDRAAAAAAAELADGRAAPTSFMLTRGAAGSTQLQNKSPQYLFGRSGRSSPSKSERTRSDLSDTSVYSNNSSGSILLPSRQTSSRSIMRSYLPSLLPAALMNPFISTTTNTISNNNHHNSSPTQSESGASNNGGGSERAMSFTTAKTTISQLQAESEALLGSSAGAGGSNGAADASTKRMRERLIQVNRLSQPRDATTADLMVPDTEPTFILHKRVPSTHAQQVSPTRSRRPSYVGTWVGSVKRGMNRALSGNRTVSLTNDVGRPGLRAGGIGADGYYDYSPGGGGGISRNGGSSSPQKSDLGGLVDLGYGFPDTIVAGEAAATANGASRSSITGKGHTRSESPIFTTEPFRGQRVHRSISDSGYTSALWEAKRGARDWDAEPIPESVNVANKILIPRRATDRATNRTGLDSDETNPFRTIGPISNLAEQGNLVPERLRPRTRSGGSKNKEEQPQIRTEPMSGRATNNDEIDDNVDSLMPPRSAKSIAESSWGGSYRSEDWDVEAAAEQRVVQVMFTVPRERLRVVNADVDAASLVSRPEAELEDLHEVVRVVRTPRDVNIDSGRIPSGKPVIKGDN